MWNKIRPYVISVAIALGVGGLSAFLTSGNMDIYSRIEQPPLAPPPILFPIVWTILYVLMGISAAMIYEEKDRKPEEVRSSLIVYAVSLSSPSTSKNHLKILPFRVEDFLSREFSDGSRQKRSKSLTDLRVFYHRNSENNPTKKHGSDNIRYPNQ